MDRIRIDCSKAVAADGLPIGPVGTGLNGQCASRQTLVTLKFGDEVKTDLGGLESRKVGISFGTKGPDIAMALDIQTLVVKTTAGVHMNQT